MLLKINLKKMYDHVSWGFLDKTMECWGFSTQVRTFILNYVGTIQYKFLLNSNIGDMIRQTRDLRQGDPLSLYLFIMTVEIFSRLMVRKENANQINGIKVCRNASTVSHLLYADDLMITFQANKSKCVGCSTMSFQVF